MKQKKWIRFNSWNEIGPYLILITDFEWWDANQTNINDWFDRNYPLCKPAKNDNIIKFNNQREYTAWCMTWD